MYLSVDPVTDTHTSTVIAEATMFAILIPITASFELAVKIVLALLVACALYLTKSCAICSPFYYNAIAIATANPLLAAPTGAPVESKYTALLAGNVQNTSLVPLVKFTAASELELVRTVVLVKVVAPASNVASPTSHSLVP
jgi:hypothetical protein